MSQTTVLKRLPSRHEIGREIVETTERAQQLRSLYRLICKIESDTADLMQNSNVPSSSTDGGRGCE